MLTMFALAAILLVEFCRSHLVLKSANASVKLTPFEYCLGSQIGLKFRAYKFSGLLLYLENQEKNCYISAKFVNDARLQVETKLVPERDTRTYSTTLVNLDSNVVHRGQHWNYLNISFLEQRSIVVGLNGFYTSRFSKVPKEKLRFETAYLGALPEELQEDASMRASFTAALESSFRGEVAQLTYHLCGQNYGSLSLHSMPEMTLKNGAEYSVSRAVSAGNPSECIQFRC
ncbi:hypothetical protein Ciccas_007386 [Cichlidogyrus casuarinus]|uniref:Laminin G domain-containing protein n=1 Tax=Cichlidogyrus casuarinus TaxID=1844966 RepID=A0ABD2Q3D9_9PLAT